MRLAAAADPREFLQNADRRPGLPPVDGAETFWAGDDGTTSHTHYDGDGNFYVQTHGRKRFTLWPPECWPEMALHPFPHAAHHVYALGRPVPTGPPNADPTDADCAKKDRIEGT